MSVREALERLLGEARTRVAHAPTCAESVARGDGIRVAVCECDWQQRVDALQAEGIEAAARAATNSTDARIVESRAWSALTAFQAVVDRERETKP